ncbi:MAG: HAD-IIB family hydrolase [Thermodesulfobacteriota bacterium]
MKPIACFPQRARGCIRAVLTDIDDTLTCRGRLPSCVFSAMERLQAAGIRVVPVTGRPAGWCDHIARMWPIDGVVGENGALYYRYDAFERKMIRRYWKSDPEREADRRRLEALARQILQQVPGARIAADQAFRVADLAIDFAEDIDPPLSMERVETIVSIFEAAGAVAKISSIHVNGWFGSYDKLTMASRFFREMFDMDLEAFKEAILYCGDSPNDAPMFGFFPHAVGVANVVRFSGKMEAEPAWVTTAEGGYGFAEMVDVLLQHAQASEVL